MTQHLVTATYRLQLNKDFPFERASALVEYLYALGISDLYCSPIFTARPGSAHGYDVLDPRTINPELGGEEAFRVLHQRLEEKAMSVIVDFVPNHMAAGEDNPYLRDVLTFGRGSPYSSWFDIDWALVERDGRTEIPIPILGGTLKKTLAEGHLRLGLVESELVITYHDRRFPVSPLTWSIVLETLRDQLKNEDAAVYGAWVQRAELQIRELNSSQSMLKQAGQLTDDSRALFDEHKREIAALLSEEPGKSSCQKLLDYTASPEGRGLFQRILDAQVYRFLYWRRTLFETSYRRFFDINELIGLCIEDDSVLDATHRAVFRLVREGIISGLRIDHIDGLLEPTFYLKRVATAVHAEMRRPSEIYVEKILLGHESLNEDWPVTGSTGYEFARDLEAAFTDRDGFLLIESRYREKLQPLFAFEDLCALCKRAVLETTLASDIERLTRKLSGLIEETNAELLSGINFRKALENVISLIPVYRTYVSARALEFHANDLNILTAALEGAEHTDLQEDAALQFLKEVLLTPWFDDTRYERWYKKLAFISRFQQVCAAAAAKGVEDTAFYRYFPLASLNEVGGAPVLPENCLTFFHERATKRAQRWPGTMTAVSTHDTKRSSDSRARLAVLSEMPAEWIKTYESWFRINSGLRTKVRGRLTPDKNTLYLIYQKMLVLWPLGGAQPAREFSGDSRQRLHAAVEKALREAKTITSWLAPRLDYEQGVHQFIDSICAHEPFLSSMAEFAHRFERAFLWSALCRSAVHLTSPGVPDIYQGDELWNLSLVDPDNRRPVDYERRRELLARVKELAADRLSAASKIYDEPWREESKLYLIAMVLNARKEAPALFRSASYTPLYAEGEKNGHLIAFFREHGGQQLIVAVPRLLWKLSEGRGLPPSDEGIWRNTTLTLPEAASGRVFRSVVTGEEVKFEGDRRIPVFHLLRSFPAAVLFSGEGRE